VLPLVAETLEKGLSASIRYKVMSAQNYAGVNSQLHLQHLVKKLNATPCCIN